MTISAHCFSLFKYLHELTLFCELNSIPLYISYITPTNVNEQMVLETNVKFMAPNNIKNEATFTLVHSFMKHNNYCVCIFDEKSYFTHAKKVETPLIHENGDIVKDKKGNPKTMIQTSYLNHYPNDRIIFTMK